MGTQGMGRLLLSVLSCSWLLKFTLLCVLVGYTGLGKFSLLSVLCRYTWLESTYISVLCEDYITECVV